MPTKLICDHCGEPRIKRPGSGNGYHCLACDRQYHRSRYLPRKPGNPTTPCEKCGGPKRYNTQGKLYCTTCRKAWFAEYNAERRKETKGILHAGCGNYGHRSIPPPKPKKPLWEPSWAAQSNPAIVSAVRDARAAERRLRG